MKDRFKGIRPMTEEELERLWKNCLVIPDANILIEMQEYEEKLKELFDIFNNLSERLWIPFQVYIEYDMKVLRLIKNEKETYDMVSGSMSKIDKKNGVEQYKRAIYDKYLRSINEIENIKNKILEIFNEKVGDPYSSQKLEDIRNDLKTRMENNMPPGLSYKDYGDLVIWHQIIDHTTSTNKDIIFVTEDSKHNWFITCDGGKIPRPELINEISSRTGANLYIYGKNEFIKRAGTYLNKNVEKLTKNIEDIKETEDIRKREEIFEKLFPGISLYPQSIKTAQEQISHAIQSINEISTRPEIQELFELLKFAHARSITVYVERLEMVPGSPTIYRIKRISTGEKFNIVNKEYNVGDKITEKEIDDIMKLHIPGIGFSYEN